MKYGYARVSTGEQFLDTQIKQLKQAGIEEKNIYAEKITGTGKIDKRTEFNKLLNQLKKDDEIVVCKLDRLGRDMYEILSLLKQLEKKGIALSSIEQGISTMGKLVIQILAAVAEAERERILERTADGRTEAMLKGIKFGRKRKLNYEAIKQEKERGLRNTEIAKKFNISLSHLNYILNI